MSAHYNIASYFLDEPQIALSPELVHILETEHQRLSLSTSQKQNLTFLKDPNTLYVITGQQLGLGLGPLFTLSKVISALAIAEKLRRETAKPVVPIFWLQSEDHDIEEIDSMTVLASTASASPAERKTYKLAHSNFIAQSSIHYYSFEGEVETLFATAFRDLNLSPEEATRFTDIAAEYRPGASPSDAFMRALSKLVGPHGMLFFNPRWTGAPNLSSAIFNAALEGFQDISTELTRNSARLEQAGREVQVKVRPDSPLLFFHPESASGARYRLRYQQGRFHIPESSAVATGVLQAQSYSLSELQELLKQSPDRFSTSALLRPLVQTSLFPNSITIGGEAELRYFSQISTLPALLGIRPLRILARASFVIIEPRTKRLLEKLQVGCFEVCVPETQFLNSLKERLLPQSLKTESLRSEVNRTLGTALRPIREAILSINGDPEQLLTRASEKLGRTLDGLFANYDQLINQKLDVELKRAQQLHNLLFPEDSPQERSYSLLGFWCKYGPDFITRLLTALDDYGDNVASVHRASSGIANLHAKPPGTSELDGAILIALRRESNVTSSSLLPEHQSFIKQIEL